MKKYRIVSTTDMKFRVYHNGLFLGIFDSLDKIREQVHILPMSVALP